eukprot:9325416-Alexandrium_andersonii.AAC.1
MSSPYMVVGSERAAPRRSMAVLKTFQHGPGGDVEREGDVAELPLCLLPMRAEGGEVDVRQGAGAYQLVDRGQLLTRGLDLLGRVIAEVLAVLLEHLGDALGGEEVHLRLRCAIDDGGEADLLDCDRRGIVTDAASPL